MFCREYPGKQIRLYLILIAWLPVPDTGLLSWQVVATEERWVALPAKHRLAHRPAVTLGDLADEPFIALPATAGPLRQSSMPIWLPKQVTLAGWL